MKKIIIGIFIVLIIVTNFAVLYSPRTPKTLVCCDEIEYYTIAKNLADGKGYSLNAQEPFNPTLLREPGYPLFLAFMLKVGNGKLILAQIFNALLSLGTALLLFKLSGELLSRSLAIIPPVIFLISPRVAYYSWTILSDILAAFLVAASILSLWVALHAHKRRHFFVTGLIFGIMVLTKMSFLLLLPALITIAILLKLIARWSKKNIWNIEDLHITTSRLLILVCGFILVLAPWFARNVSQFGTLTPTVRTGQLIFERTRHYNHLTPTFQGLAQIPNDILAGWSTAFQQEKKPPIKSPSGVIYDAASAPGHFFALNTNRSEREADQIMARESVKLIRTYPYLYLFQIPFEFLKFNYLEFLPGVFNTISGQSMPLAQLIVLAGLILIISILSFCLFLRGIIALYRNASLLGWLILLFLLYTNIIHELLYVTPRYSFVVYPIIALVIVYGAETLKIKKQFVFNHL